MSDTEKSGTKIRAVVAIVAAVITCLGTIIAALIGKMDIFDSKTLPTLTPNIQFTSAPFGYPTPTPFLAQAPSIPTLSPPTKPILTITPMPVQGGQMLSITGSRIAEVYSGNLTISVISIDAYFNRASLYISAPGYPILFLENKRVGYKVVYPANDSYEVQIMGIVQSNNSTAVNVSVLKLDNLPKAEFPVIIVAKEQQNIAGANAGVFYNGSLVIALTSVDSYFNRVSAEISAPGYEVLSFTDKYVGYKTQYKTDKKYEIQVTGITPDNNGTTATFVVSILE
jgi:hypothetical protein